MSTDRYDCLKPYLLPFTKLSLKPSFKPELVLEAGNSEQKTVERFKNVVHQRFIEANACRVVSESQFVWNIRSINDLDVSPHTINKRKYECLSKIIKATDLLKPLSEIVVGYFSYWDGSIDAEASRLIVESFQFRPYVFFYNNNFGVIGGRRLRCLENTIDCVKEILYFDEFEMNVKVVLFRTSSEKISGTFGFAQTEPEAKYSATYFSSSLKDIIKHITSFLWAYKGFSLMIDYINKRFVLL